jgi:CHASE2 domain-containing sensor protein
MYGVVIHANVISQILQSRFVNVMGFSLSIVISMFLSVVNVGLFNYFEERTPNWYDALTILIFLIQSVVLTFLLVVIFNRYHYKMNLTLTLGILALTPTVHDIYHNSVKPLFLKAVHKIRRKHHEKPATQPELS